ncbi:MAG: OmpA family protein [Cytophagaceae bacterium]|jgi:outer membrane protein OmpA-like peptidoglycan-associated protein/Tol biopolymer transport system component|nr:OmpA family protein [Cytophagaceae bacterium]
MGLIRRLCLFFFIFLHFPIYSQSTSKEVRKWMEEGSSYYSSGYWFKAIQAYEKALELSPSDPGIHYSLVLCYYQTDQFRKMLNGVLVAQKAGIDDPMIHYYLGLAYHANYKFNEAILAFQQHKTTLSKSDKMGLYKTDLLIKHCTNAIQLPTEKDILITNLGAGINSSYPEYNPAISVDESTVLFTSRRVGSTGGQIYPIDNLYFEDIYQSTQIQKKWNPASNIGTIVNTDVHDACVGLSADGQQMLVYRDENGNNGDLYLSQLKGTVWQTPVNLGKMINSTYYEPCGSFSADGQVLFFVSNRAGGYGGLDIYYSRKTLEGTWSKPMNMGPQINTMEDEFSPYLHADGKTFYFSTDGELSMGGYDIVECSLQVREEGIQILTSPKNMAHPINTPEDEVYFVWSADNKRAYFSSVRDGGYGDKDLYVLQRKEADAALVMLKGTIVDCISKQPIEAKIEVFDHSTGTTLGKYFSNSATGKYIVILPAGKNYAIEVDAREYLFYSKNIDIPALLEYKEIEDLICLDKIAKGTKIILHNVFFDVDKASLRTESELELNKLFEILLKNPSLKIEVSGHTDSDGDAAHNLSLSEARAHAVKDYLILKGIDPNRIVYKGYGESVPIAENTSPENKQLNRRTEIKILEN